MTSKFQFKKILMKIPKIKLTPYLFLLPALIIFCIFLLLPIVNVVYTSFFRWDGVSPTMNFIGTENFKELFLDPYFLNSLKVTWIIVLQSIFFQLPVGLILAIILTKKLRGAEVSSTIIFSPMIISLIAVALIWTWMYDPYYGIINEGLRGVGLQGLTQPWLGDPGVALFAVIMAINWVYIGLYMVIFMAGLRSIPQSIFESARIDGLSEFRTTTRIIIPLLKEIIAVAIIMCITGAFKTFDMVWAMTQGGPVHVTEMTSLYLYRVAFRMWRVGYASSIAVFVLLMCIVVLIIQFKIMRIKVG